MSRAQAKSPTSKRARAEGRPAEDAPGNGMLGALSPVEVLICMYTRLSDADRLKFCNSTGLQSRARGDKLEATRLNGVLRSTVNIQSASSGVKPPKETKARDTDRKKAKVVVPWPPAVTKLIDTTFDAIGAIDKEKLSAEQKKTLTEFKTAFAKQKKAGAAAVESKREEVMTRGLGELYAIIMRSELPRKDN